MTRRIWIIADDYGLAPGICNAIVELIDVGRLSGTSCMTGFASWPEDAAQLRPLLSRTAIGLHLTLTDQQAVSPQSTLAPGGKLPSLKALTLSLVTGRIRAADLDAELDVQLQLFTEAIGRQPDFIDGHQHVHFLPPVRRWLQKRFGGGLSVARPALRGAPVATSPKAAAIAALALGFDQEMHSSGFSVIGPLSGIYDWTDPSRFADVLRRGLKHLPDGALFMCHPGRLDSALASRDVMQSARPTEFDFLRSDQFESCLRIHDVSVGIWRP